MGQADAYYCVHHQHGGFHATLVASCCGCYFLQIPARLGKAACKLYRHDIHSQATSIATRSVLRLLDQAQSVRISRSQRTSTGASPLALALKQQLLDSGLVEQLPLLLCTAAQHMRAADSYINSSSSDSSSDERDYSSWGVLQVPLCVTQDAFVVHSVFAVLSDTWPHTDPTKASQEFESTVGVHCIFPLAQLSVAGMQHLSWQLGMLDCSSQTMQMPHPVFANLAAVVKSAAIAAGAMAVAVLSRLSPNSAQHKELSAQLMHSTEYLSCVALQLLLLDVTPVVHHAAAGAGLYQMSQQVWQLVGSLEGQVPSYQIATLGYTGCACNGRAALWVAAHQPCAQTACWKGH